MRNRKRRGREPGDGWIEEGALCSTSDDTAWVLWSRWQGSWLNLKITAVGKARRRRKANFWLAWNSVENRLAVSHDATALAEYPEIRSALDRWLVRTVLLAA